MTFKINRIINLIKFPHFFLGTWISRSILNRWRAEGKKGVEKKGNRERGKDYNHSTFVDLVISGLIGKF